MKASIIIPSLISNYRLLQLCLQSLDKQSLVKKDFEVILVLNAGYKPENFEKLKINLKNFKLIKLDKNLGFAGAVNTGFRKAKGEYLIALNDDVIVDKNWLKELVKVAQDKKEKADMVASKIFKISKEQAKLFVSSKVWQGNLSSTDNRLKIDSLGFKFLMKGKAIPIREIGQNPFGPDAAAALYRKKMLDDIGMFDESFFAYLEDVDLAYRARKKSYKCVLAENALAYHVKHATSKKMGNFKAKQDMINWWRLILKNYNSDDWRKYGFKILIERLKNFKGWLIN